jgi:hypothetical protein
VFDDGKVPWVTKKLAGGISCSGWRMAGGIFFMVTYGCDNRLCHGDDVSTKGSEEAR